MLTGITPIEDLVKQLVNIVVKHKHKKEMFYSFNSPQYGIEWVSEVLDTTEYLIFIIKTKLEINSN